MSEVPSDPHREQQTLLNRIAAGIFARHGVDFSSAQRLGGWTNANWRAGGLVLRLAVRQGRQNLRSEARLARLLPPEVGFPPVLESGETDGYEWCLAREIPGGDLGEVWPALDWEARISALRQVWQKARAVHSVDADSAAALARKGAWFNSTSAEDAHRGLTRLEQQKIFTSRQVTVLESALDRFWTVLPSAACVLNHGDLTLDNALWREGEVVALLDFEFAVIAPPELDLNALLKYAFFPGQEVDLPNDPGGTGLQRLRDAAADLAQPVLAPPGGKELLTGYAILLELWLLEDWLAHPEGEGPFEQWQPYLRLVSLADGQGGYLAPLLAAQG